MGLTGSGKTALCKKLCNYFGYYFYDIYKRVPKRYIEKIYKNQVITDEEIDEYLIDMIGDFQKKLQNGPLVVAIGPLKRKHQKMIVNSIPDSLLIMLDVSHEILGERLAKRKELNFNKDFLQTSIDTEEMFEEGNIKVYINQPLDNVFIQIKHIISTYNKLAN